jgi:hypothetical protein
MQRATATPSVQLAPGLAAPYTPKSAWTLAIRTFRSLSLIARPEGDRLFRRGLEDLVGSPQLAVLPLQRLQPLAPVRREPWPVAPVDLGSPDPLAKRLRGDTDDTPLVSLLCRFSAPAPRARSRRSRP